MISKSSTEIRAASLLIIICAALLIQFAAFERSSAASSAPSAEKIKSVAAWWQRAYTAFVQYGDAVRVQQEAGQQDNFPELRQFRNRGGRVGGFQPLDTQPAPLAPPDRRLSRR